MSGNSGDSEYTVRYAGYLENAHAWLMSKGNAHYSETATSPYQFDYNEPITAFVGAAADVTVYPSLFDIFGKFGAGLDVTLLWSQIVQHEKQSGSVNAAIATESDFLEDDTDSNTDRLTDSISNMNYMLTSAYLDSKDLIDSNRENVIDKFAADLRLKGFEMTNQRVGAHLTWNENVTELYLNIVRNLYTLDDEYISNSAKNLGEDALWPLTRIGFLQEGVSALIGSASAMSQKQSPSVLGTIMSVLQIAALFSYIM